jgi:hypothetical protein
MANNFDLRAGQVKEQLTSAGKMIESMIADVKSEPVFNDELENLKAARYMLKGTINSITLVQEEVV